MPPARTAMAGKANRSWDVLGQAPVAQGWTENRGNGSREELSSLPCPGKSFPILMLWWRVSKAKAGCVVPASSRAVPKKSKE